MAKMKKSTGYNIILHMCTKNHNHMRYASWDTVSDRQTCLSVCTSFCAFNPSGPIKIWKKSNWRCQHFTHVYQKLRSHYVCFFEIWSAIYTNFCYLGPIFALLHHYWLQKLEFRKMSKKHLEILSLYTCVPKMEIICCIVPEK